MKKRFLGILLSFALILTMMPVMSQTAHADNTETLLTTIESTSPTNYSETTPGVVTVSHDNTGYGMADVWWYWTKAGTLTVSACEGYTITKCVFKEFPTKSFTDTEAPFALNFGDDGHAQENPDMYGVSLIEVYGYATPTPAPIPAPASASVTVNSKTVSASSLAAAYAKAGVNPDSVATVVLGKKVKKIKKGSFQNLRNASTLVVKSKKLTKARVKGSLKGSSITKVKVNVGKKTNKKYVKKYKKIFTKKNCGKKVRVTR